MTKSKIDPKDKYGFPLTNCTRCGGSGRHSFNLIDRDVCYGCGGTGMKPLNKKVAAARSAFLEAARKQRQPVAKDLKPGDMIVVSDTGHPLYGAEGKWSWVEVDRVDPAGRYDWLVIFYKDGRSSPPSINPGQIIRRKGILDPAPYLALAGKEG